MNTRQRPARHTRQTVRLLIEEGLGYCCQWAFFSLYQDTLTIALRLGVTSRAIRYAKASFAAGEMKCKNCERCMKDKLAKRNGRSS